MLRPAVRLRRTAVIISPQTSESCRGADRCNVFGSGNAALSAQGGKSGQLTLVRKATGAARFFNQIPPALSPTILPALADRTQQAS